MPNGYISKPMDAGQSWNSQNIVTRKSAGRIGTVVVVHLVDTVGLPFSGVNYLNRSGS